MYDKKIKELEENLDEIEGEIADLKETNARLIREIESLASELSSSQLVASAIREIQDEMKKQNRKLILIHEV